MFHYMPELEICWQCGGDGTIDEEICPLCENGHQNHDCRQAIPRYRTVRCPVCQNNDDQDPQGLPLETV